MPTMYLTSKHNRELERSVGQEHLRYFHLVSECPVLKDKTFAAVDVDNYSVSGRYSSQVNKGGKSVGRVCKRCYKTHQDEPKG